LTDLSLTSEYVTVNGRQESASLAIPIRRISFASYISFVIFTLLHIIIAMRNNLPYNLLVFTPSDHKNWSLFLFGKFYQSWWPCQNIITTQTTMKSTYVKIRDGSYCLQVPSRTHQIASYFLGVTKSKSPYSVQLGQALKRAAATHITSRCSHTTSMGRIYVPSRRLYKMTARFITAAFCWIVQIVSVPCWRSPCSTHTDLIVSLVSFQCTFHISTLREQRGHQQVLNRFEWTMIYHSHKVICRR
jgi:hypothetical protein